MVDTSAEQKDLIGEIEDLQALTDEIMTVLRSQHDLLKKGGMDLPQDPLDSLSAIGKDLRKVKDRVQADERELVQLRALADQAAAINTSLDLNEVLNNAMDVVIKLTGAERGYIMLRDPESGEMRFQTIREQEGAATPTNETPQISRTILKAVVDSGDPLLTDDAFGDERLAQGVSIANMQLRSVVCVPLEYRGNIIGVVYVDNRFKTGIFTELELNLLVAFANQAAVAIQNARLFSDVQESIITNAEMKELMDNVFASIASGVLTADGEGQITTFNPAAGKILRHDVQSAIGRVLYDVFPQTDSLFDEYLYAALQEDRRDMLEAEISIDDVESLFLSMRFSPLKNAEQQTQGVALVVDDLTEARARENMINVMQRYLPEALVENIHEIAQLALGGERREVSSFFVDVRPLSTFPATMRPQEIMEALNHYLIVGTDCIHEAGGIVDKYMGNEIMVLFNTQLNPLEDHAMRAVQCALNMRAAFLQLYAELNINPDPHFYSMGIHSGIATLGNVGSHDRREFTAIGDTINLSKRLQENATDGQILISGDTFQMLRNDLEKSGAQYVFEERGQLKVKGREKPVATYEVFQA